MVVHGNKRDAGTYFATVAGLAAARDPVHTMVVAPWFQTDPATPGGCTKVFDASLPRDLYWSCAGWKDGAAAMNDATTSFGAIDVLVAAVKQAFPSIVRVIIVGYSAGGQIVQRYLAGSKEEDRTPRIKTKFIVGSPSSFLYLDDRRLKQDAACPDEVRCAVDATRRCRGSAGTATTAASHHGRRFQCERNFV